MMARTTRIELAATCSTGRPRHQLGPCAHEIGRTGRSRTFNPRLKRPLRCRLRHDPMLVPPRRIERRSAANRAAALPLCYGSEMVRRCGAAPLPEGLVLQTSGRKLPAFPPRSRSRLNWYARRDSNPHCRRSERRASCRLGYARVVLGAGFEPALDGISDRFLCRIGIPELVRPLGLQPGLSTGADGGGCRFRAHLASFKGSPAPRATRRMEARPQPIQGLGRPRFSCVRGRRLSWWTSALEWRPVTGIEPSPAAYEAAARPPC